MLEEAPILVYKARSAGRLQIESVYPLEPFLLPTRSARLISVSNSIPLFDGFVVSDQVMLGSIHAKICSDCCVVFEGATCLLLVRQTFILLI
jgi:hypothetical protein